VPKERINEVSSIQYEDSLKSLSEPVRLRYAVRFVNRAGQRASFSNFIVIEPTTDVAAPPGLSDPRATNDFIILSWTPPVENINSTRPVNLLGFNIYRTQPKDSSITLLNSTPVNAQDFQDRSFRFGEEYSYFVRSVSLGRGGLPVESNNSNTVSINPLDTFPPSAPASLTLGVAPARLSLFFPANPERDIAGYNVYRSTDSGLPKEEWTKLNRELITRTTFVDEEVETGKTYYYYLQAVDHAGNLSQPSDVVSETVP
jgi:hypothetical protein